MEPQDFYFGQLGPTSFPRSNLGMSYGQGYSPVAAPQPFMPRFGMENLPFSGNLLGRMTLPVLAHQMVRGQNIALTGYGHDQNVYDVMRNRQVFFAQREATKLAQQFDQENYMRTARGVFRAAGEPFDMNQRRFARTVTSGLAQMTPYIAEMAPGVAEEMGGMMGSASVLSRRLFDTGRYQIDPVSGRFGLSANTVNAMTRDIYQTAMKQPSRFGSLTSGQLGDLYGQLQSRGMTATSYDPVSTAAALDPFGLAMAAKRTGVDMKGGAGALSTKDVDKLLGDSQLSGKLRAFDSVRVKQTLENYAKAIDSIKDIMGDNGEHNAPMQKVFAALEELSMGSMNRLGAGKVAQVVGQTYAISKRVGMPIENVLGMQRHAADLASRLGLDPAFAMYGAQAGMLANGAYRNMGLGSQNYFGAMSVNEFTQTATNSLMTASASQSAKNLASIIRAYESNPSGSSPVVKAIVDAAKSGQSQFMDPVSGKTRNLVFDQAATVQLMKMTGLSAGSAQQIMRQDYRNQEIILRDNLGAPIANAGQGDEFRSLATKQIGAIIRAKVGTVLKGKQATNIASEVSGKVLADIDNLAQTNPADVTNGEKVKGILKKHLAAHPDYANLSTTEKDRLERELSLELPGHMDAMTRNSVFRNRGNFTNALVSTSPAASRAMSQINEQSNFDRTMREAMRPLNKGGGLLQRAVGALQDIRITDTGKDGMVGRVLGGVLGVPTSAINEQLQKKLVEVESHRRGFEETRNAIGKATGAERERLVKELKTKEDAVKRAVGEATDIATKEGIIADSGFSKSDLTDLGRMRTEQLTTAAELSGMAYGFSTEVNAEQAKTAIAGAKSRASVEDATLYVMTQKRQAAKSGRVDPAFAAAVRKNNPNVSEEDLRTLYMRHVSGSMPSQAEVKAAQEKLRSGKIDMDTDTAAAYARVLVNRDRDSIASRASFAEVTAQMSNPRFAGLTRDEVSSAINLDRIAAKLGLTEQEIGVGADKPIARGNAIQAAIKKRQDEYYNIPANVTGEDQINKHFAEKRAARDKQFDALYMSGGYALVKDMEDDFDKQAQSYSSRIMESGRRGQASVESIETAQGINKLLAEQRNLVDSYYGGDIVRARTNRGNFENTREGRELEKATASRMAAIQTQLHGMLNKGVGGLQGGKIGQQFPDTIAGDQARSKFLSREIESLYGAPADFAKVMDAMKMYHAQGGNLGKIDDFFDARTALLAEARKLDPKGTDEEALKKFLETASSSDDIGNLKNRYYEGIKAGYDKADVTRLRDIRDKYKGKGEAASAAMGDSYTKVKEYLRLFGSGTGDVDSLAAAVGRRGMASIEGRLEDATGLAAIARTAQMRFEGGSDEDKVKAALLGSKAIPTLIAEYDKATASGGDLDGFRKAYGLTSDADFASFKAKVSRSKRMLGSSGELDTGKLMTDLEEATSQPGGGESRQMEVVFPKDARLTLSGTVGIDGGGIITLDSRTSGQLENM